MSNQFGSRLDDHGFELYEENQFPIAYLLTFRTFGTWLHGDSRQSMQRTHNGRLGTIILDPNVPLEEQMTHDRQQSAVILTTKQRQIVETAIRETCKHRGHLLRAANVRTNHAHVVTSAAVVPEKIVNDLKAFATRRLREEGEFGSNQKIWARGSSRRNLWKPRSVEAAVEYVLYSQGDIPFDAVSEFDVE
jgi:REP element-mobilizing transposase RayT